MSEVVDHVRTYDVNIVAQSLSELHEQVCKSNGRVELTCPGSNARCVLISKQELDALERALAILSDTEGVREISQRIALLAAAEYASA